MNTTVEKTVESKNAELSLGNGKYSGIAKEYCQKAEWLFGFSVEQQNRFGHALMADLGRNNVNVQKLKFSKTDVNGMVKYDESGKSDKVSETFAMTLCAGIDAIIKGMERIPNLKHQYFILPENLQFNAKKQS